MQKYEYKTQPYEHQRKALNNGGLLKNYAYFMEMGTGKTKVAIDNVAYLWQNEEIKECVVIAPNSVYTNWVQEIVNHCRRQSPGKYSLNLILMPLRIKRD